MIQILRRGLRRRPRIPRPRGATNEAHYYRRGKSTEDGQNAGKWMLQKNSQRHLKAIRGDGGVVLVVLRVHAQTARRERPPECADVDSAKAIDISLDPSIASGDDYGEY